MLSPNKYKSDILRAKTQHITADSPAHEKIIKNFWRYSGDIRHWYEIWMTQHYYLFLWWLNIRRGLRVFFRIYCSLSQGSKKSLLCQTDPQFCLQNNPKDVNRREKIKQRTKIADESQINTWSSRIKYTGSQSLAATISDLI